MAPLTNTRVAVTVANPAPGANFGPITVPAGQRWRLLAITFKLQSSAAAGNRDPGILIKDASGNVVYRILGAGNFGASGALQQTLAVGLRAVQSFAGAICSAPLPPDLLMEAGWTITSLVDATFDVADQFSQIVYTYENGW